MALKPDPSETRRLLGDNTSEFVQLAPGQLTSYPLGIWMLSGDDTVGGSSDRDLVYGNLGEDILLGEGGNDSLFGGKNADDLDGGLGDDYLNGGEDNDLVSGGDGNDILIGGKGNDIIIAGNGDDTLIGSLGKDYLANLNLDGSQANGRKTYILQVDPSAIDVNSTDVITAFNQNIDQIGLTGGLTENDITLTQVNNVNISISYEFSTLSSSFSTGRNGPTSGTLIQVKNSGANLGYVESLTPEQLRGRFISTQGF